MSIDDEYQTAMLARDDENGTLAEATAQHIVGVI